MTAIKPAGTLRRCLYNQDDDLMDYENQNEAYPLAICTLLGDFIRPSKAQVPDVEITNELWSLYPCVVADTSLVWLGRRTVQYEEDRVVSFTTVDPTGKDHPWLDGKGHPLISSAMGGDHWPPPFRPPIQNLFLDNGIGHGGLVSLLTMQEGYGIVNPLEGGPPYRERLDWLREYTGFQDINGAPIFDRDWVSVPNVPKASGFTVLYDGTQWIVEAGDQTVFPLCNIAVKSLELHRRIKLPY